MSNYIQICREAISKLDPNDICKIISNYDDLLKNISVQVDFYKKHHETIRSEIYKVLEENEKLGKKIQFISSQSENSDSLATKNYKKLASCIINNLQSQILKLTEEKNTLHTCWKTSQNIIKNLEKNIKVYDSMNQKRQSIDEVKREYNSAIALLKSNVAETKEQLIEQQIVNKELNELKIKKQKDYDTLCIKYKKLENEHKIAIENLRKTENLLVETKQRLADMIKRKSEIDQYLIKSSSANREQSVRETVAIAKVQDALDVAETALKEKRDAIVREQIIQDECEMLTSTINQVIEKAAKRQEVDVRSIEESYNAKIRVICSKLESLKISLATQIDKTKAAENKIQLLEDELKNTVTSNKRLDLDLHVASQTIIEMELKLEAFEKLMEREEETNKICEERANDLQQTLKKNRQLKEKWKITVEDIANKLQSEIKQLQKENFALKNENANLKISRNNIGITPSACWVDLNEICDNVKKFKH